MPVKIDPAKLAMIREEYRTSIVEPSLRALADKYDLSDATLRGYSAREGWLELRKAYLAQLSQREIKTAYTRAENAAQQVLTDHKKTTKALRRARDQVAHMVLMRADELDEMWHSLSPVERARLYPTYCKTLGELAKVVELFSGGATERVDVQGEPISLTREEAEVWARLRARIEGEKSE